MKTKIVLMMLSFLLDSIKKLINAKVKSNLMKTEEFQISISLRIDEVDLKCWDGLNV